MDVESARSRNMTPGEDRDNCWRYLTFAETAREIMPDRLESRYFDNGDDAPEAVNEEDEDVAYGADTIESCAHTLTGYVTVTARVLAANDIGDTGVKLVLEDKSGAIDMVAWDADTADILREHEGETIVVKNAEVSEYDGTRQLSVADGVTAVDTIQQGVGHTETQKETGADTLSSSSTAATDGGGAGRADEAIEDSEEPDETDDSRATVMDKLYNLVESHGNQPVEQDELVSALDMDDEKAKERIGKMKTDGVIQKMNGGYIPK